MCACTENSMKNTDLLDVKLKVLEDSMRILTNHERLHLYTGTSEILCRAVLLDKEQIGPGEEGLVQLRLEEEIADQTRRPFCSTFLFADGDYRRRDRSGTESGA